MRRARTGLRFPTACSRFAALLDHDSIQFLVLGHHLLREESFREPLRTRVAEPPAELRVAREALEGVRERGRVFRGDEQPRPAVDDRFGEAPDARGDDRTARRHRLERGDAEALVARGQHEEVAGREEVGRILATSEETDAGREAQALDLRLERGALGSFARDPGDDLGARERERLEEQVDALAAHERREREHDDGALGRF
jgi:hypothetical protein